MYFARVLRRRRAGVDMSLGGGEILVVLLVALIVFGPQRMPEIGRQVGKAMRELRKMQDSVRDEVRGALHIDEHDAEHDAAHDAASHPPSYGEQRPVAHESERGEPAPLPHADPPSSGSFS